MRTHRRRAPPPRSTRPRDGVRGGSASSSSPSPLPSTRTRQKELGLTHAAHNVVHHQIATFEFETVLASESARRSGGKSPVVGLEVMIAVSVPSYRRFSNVSVVMVGAPSEGSRVNPCSSSWATTRASSSQRRRRRLPQRSSGVPKGLCASATTSAMPMPYADRMPQNLCTKTVRMPRDRAMAHACCGPAPPKAARTCGAVSKPLLSVISRIGRHIASFATRGTPAPPPRSSEARIPTPSSRRVFSRAPR